MELEIVTKKAKHLCHVKGCRRKHGLRSPLCSRHAMRLWRFQNPHRAAYANIRDSARKRKIVFSITFDEFCELVRHTQYMDGKGRERYCYHMDRIDATRGYEWGNLQIITCTENVIKGNMERRAGYVAVKIQQRTVIETVPCETPEDDFGDWCDDLPASTFIPDDDTPF